MTDTETLIVGGGLAGLSLAATLSEQKRDFLLLEARDRLGGRILEMTHGDASFDMGPAWFWPGQPRIAALITKLGLTQFDQYHAGDLMFEDERGQTQRGRGFASMQGSYRLRGGLSSLIKALASELDPNRIFLGADIRQMTKTDHGITVRTADGQNFSARKAVMAIPPRIAATLDVSPEFPAGARTAMASVPTWMAGQAKAMAVYDRAFWREAGLSGDAMSRFGPLAEIHDASPADETAFALFGFIGVPASRRQDEPALKAAILQQLIRLFGEDAAHPVALHIKDWARDPHTATAADLEPVYTHPHYGLPDALSNLWEERLIFGGTEIAPHYGGYLEGALEAAEIVVSKLQHVAV
ncbi:MAG: FAD-dependent oxidoreductase [Pseudomonadota bacterium]